MSMRLHYCVDSYSRTLISINGGWVAATPTGPAAAGVKAAPAMTSRITQLPKWISSSSDSTVSICHVQKVMCPSEATGGIYTIMIEWMCCVWVCHEYWYSYSYQPHTSKIFIILFIASIIAYLRWLYAKQPLEMESFCDQWLESIGKENYAPLFSSHGYTTFAKCAQLTEEELTSVGVTDDADRKYILDWAGDLQGRQEADVIRQLPVSVLPTELSIISSNTPPY